MAKVCARACEDAATWQRGGADALLIENFGDRPFFPAQVPAITVAAMARVVAAVQATSPLPLGVNVLRNDATSALSLASAFDLDFVRINVHTGASVTDQGILQGQAHLSVRLREQLPGSPAIFADVDVKHGHSMGAGPLIEQARDLVERGCADALLLTGVATGAEPDLMQLRELRANLPQVPILLASGVHPDLLRRSLPDASGWIVGTWAKRDRQTLQPPMEERVRELVAARDHG